MAALVIVGFAATIAQAQQASPAGPPQLPSDASPASSPPPPAARYSSAEIIDAGHHFFGGISKGIASIVEKAADHWGEPNGYILGEEAGGAFIGGLRYGDGTLFTKDAGDLRVFRRGPTIGVDLGADGVRTMMLVYNLPRTSAIHQQFNGIAGAAYFIAGLGMTTLTSAMSIWSWCQSVPGSGYSDTTSAISNSRLPQPGIHSDNRSQDP